jgi:hypothetical protein
MKWEKVQNLPEKQFRRIVGVKRKTFEKMLEIVVATSDKKKAEAKAPGGRPPKLSMEDRVLMTLEYLREYRTYANIGISYGLCESKTWANIKWIEDALIKSKEFSLPGRKALLKSDNEIEVVLIDATETPIERPKKNSTNITQERKNGIR